MKFISLALLALFAICSTARAQLAPQRTWPELKEAVQERANRNAYPMTGMKPDDVREILSQINSLDRDEWAGAWAGWASAIKRAPRNSRRPTSRSRAKVI